MNENIENQKVVEKADETGTHGEVCNDIMARSRPSFVKLVRSLHEETVAANIHIIDECANLARQNREAAYRLQLRLLTSSNVHLCTIRDERSSDHLPNTRATTSY